MLDIDTPVEVANDQWFHGSAFGDLGAAADTVADWREGLPTLGGATLRELEVEDAASLHAHLTTEEVSRYISPPPTTVEGFEAFIRWAHRRRAQGKYACFAVVPKGHTRAVGLFQLHLHDTDPQRAEWGFVLGQAYWGTGLFVACAEQVVEFAFGQMGLQYLVAYAVVQNGRGNGALAKLGAHRLGVRFQSLACRGGTFDQLIWTLDRQSWRARIAAPARTLCC